MLEITYFVPTYGARVFTITEAELAYTLEWLNAGGYMYRRRRIGA